MTKTEKQAMQKFFNRLGEIDKKRDEIFKRLQVENKRVNGNAWCCAQTNAEELLKAGCKWAEYSYEEYVKLGGQYDLMLQFGQELANIDFWKDRAKGTYSVRA